jgi:hypothetical protein
MNSIKSRGAPVVAFGLQGEAPGVAMIRVPSLRNLCGFERKSLPRLSSDGAPRGSIGYTR